jgi:Cu/Ag efflux protein CusF
MKLNFLILALVAAFGLSLACPAHAATTNTAPVMTAPAVKKTPYKGTLTAVDTATSTITVKGAKDTLMMTVTPTTKFKGGASLADFKVGDNVTGSYVKDETGKMTASSLHKKVAKP